MMTSPGPYSDAFARHQYLNLVTFRRSGVGVRTPVWFVENQGRLSVEPALGSGKVKRLRHQGCVRLVPSDAYGNPKGAWIGACAQRASPEQAGLVKRLFLKKYGLPLRGFEAMMRLRGGRWVTLRIDPPAMGAAGGGE